MGRHHKNIKMQLNKALDNKLMIGQKKEKIYSNPNKADGIHSIRTAETYRSVICSFGDYLKEQGIREISNIGREEIRGYLDSRSDKSAWTLTKDLSAINKVLGTEYTGKEMGLPIRHTALIRNNRGECHTHTSDSERNAEAIRFVEATGIRRQSISTITPGQAVYGQSGQVVAFNVVEKGGRERLCVVLEGEREWITNLVNERALNGLNTPMLNDVDHNANPHLFRAEYAQNLYVELLQAREEGKDYYDGLRSQIINEQNAERAQERYRHEVYKGYHLAVVAEVSQNLGHNRLDVVLNHYLR